MYNYDAAGSGIGALFAILAGLMFFFVIIAIVLHILMALGLYKMAQNRGIENPWLAWIPVANLYILGKLIGSLSISSWEVPSVELFLPIGAVVAAILGQIPLIGGLISLAFAVLMFFALHRLFKIYRPQSVTLWLILSIILFFMGPIFIFIMRNDSLVAEESSSVSMS
ncbi:MAG: hypothetical protein ACOX6S_15125 [Clostridia bacterium]|jgi:hypothetical protein